MSESYVACGDCLVELVYSEDDEWRTGGCPNCGRICFVMSKTKGALDLGIVREDPPGGNQLHIFEESFQSIIDREKS
jgi:DNA-directed RNA polymerase subunit RPC12/RpoP